MSAPPAQRRFSSCIPDGILLVDKPAGPTSHDVVDRIRRTFRLAKVGHGGSLDPQATGLLIILVGRGTKLSNAFLGSDKTYEGTMRLGVTTDSYDLDGRVERECDWSGIEREAVESAMVRFRGDIMQEPPMVSAVKKDGVPLYKLARRGETVERQARLVHIYDFSMTHFDLPLVRFVMRCTKGTYVRSVAHEMGLALGCGAALSQLRRTASGRLRIEEARALDAILDMDPEALSGVVIPMHAAQALL
jgi:tRNA pseudouridine55 synthase